MPVPEKHAKIVHWEIVERGPVTRAAAADAAAEEGDGTDAADNEVFPVVISTETPCETYYGLEVLSHSKSAIDMSLARNGISLYLDHGGYPFRPTPDPLTHIGIVEDIAVGDDRKLRGNMRFSRHELAQRCKQDWKDGTLRYGSVRAFPIKRKVTRDSTDPNAVDVVTFTRWRPEEFSLVGIPADAGAGRARSAAGVEEFAVETEAEDAPATTTTQEDSAVLINDEPKPDSAAAAAAGAASTVRSAGAGGGGATTIERDDVTRIIELCNSNGCPERATDFVRRGLSPGDAGLEILEGKKAAQATTRTKIPTSAEDLGLSKKDARRYSVTRALNQMLEYRTGRRSDFDGVEGEVHKALEKQIPMSATRHGGILIPLRMEHQDVELEADRRSRTRALGSGVSGGGAELVFDRPMEMIELLTNRALVAQFGAQIFTGLMNTIQFPKETSDVTVYCMGENPASGAPASSPGYGTIDMVPKTLIGNVLIPRQLLALAAIDVEARVKFRLMRQHGLKTDRLFLHGTGTDGQPLGLYLTPGVQTKAMGGAVDFGELVDMETLIADVNADVETMAYMATPKLAGKLKQTLEFSAAGSVRIWTGKLSDGEVNGYRAGATKQLSGTLSGLVDGAGSEQGLVHGDFSQAALGYWGAFEAVTDNLTKADSGQVKVVTYQMFDSAVLRPEAFVVATGATA